MGSSPVTGCRRTAFLAVLLGLAVAGCAGVRPEPARFASAAPDIRACANKLRLIDQTVREVHVRDAAGRAVAGFPYLRTNRFLASFGRTISNRAQLAAWMARLYRFDLRARRIELANLPGPARARLEGQLSADAEKVVERCGARLMAADLEDAETLERLLSAVRPPDHYHDWNRFFGLYAFTAIPVSAGYRRWKRKTLTDFNTPLDQLEVAGELMTYVPEARSAPLTPAQVAVILARSADNPLAIPEPEGRDLQRLLAAFAPVWQVETQSDDDRIGAPAWAREDRAYVDTTRPEVYTVVSHMRWQGRILLQLSYAVWFPARPKRGRLDLLGGRFDGVIWRVTLDADGRVLLYDSVHQCGCYHLFFPRDDLAIRPEAAGVNSEDGVTAPRAAPEVKPGERVIIRLTAGSHYIRNLGVWKDGRSELASPDRIVYTLTDYDRLRSLALPAGGRRSLFRPDGLVAGSARLERFLLWPMGIRSAGAMRQWGTHATAFVGRRHFDDPDLLEKSFFIAGRAGS